MAERITTRDEDFSQWYQDIVVQSKLADYSPVKGCMVIRPNGYAIWENIQKYFNAEIEEVGVENAYFPVFIPESFLKKEAEHVEGFAPQCAVVTYAGAKDLEEKLVVRPTSETIINSMFSKWIQSYRDLPLMINQWANVVRWEMRTRLFLRTTEFLWQEGHTCHATLDDAESLTIRMLQVYKKFVEERLAMPVIAGLKSESEKFAGALRTYCIEAMMQDTKALQAGTSHNLSNHFAKAFDTKFLGKDGKQEFVYQTSWGVSTRLIGGMIMTHSDDKGLVLPPAVAKTHVAIVPIMGKDPEAGQKVLEVAEKIESELHGDHSELPYRVRVKLDSDQSKSPGFKFHEYEVQGMPIRIELGPRDLEKNQVAFVRRDQGERSFVPIADVKTVVLKELEQMQRDLLENAKKFRSQNSYEVDDYADFKKQIEEKGGFYTASWNGSAEVEEKVKEETKATIRCLLLDENHQPIKDDRPCLVSGDRGNNFKVIYAKSY